MSCKQKYEVQRYYNETLDEEMLSAVHESGLKVYVFPKKGFSKYYAIYGTDYGSTDREFVIPGDTEKTVVPDGIAHYLEHKMFEQPDGTNAFDSFALTGASSNAFTSFDLTAYLFSCTDKFYENLDILLDFVNKPYFTDENVQKEQGIIGQEIKMYDDDPGWRVFFNALTALFKNNPVKIDIAGTVESIAKIDKDVLYKCYNTFYNPGNMTLVLVGDIDIDEVMNRIDKHIDSSRNLGEIQRPGIIEPDERVTEYNEQRLMVSQPMFQVGFKETVPYTTGEELLKRELATDIIIEILFGRSSDFYMELYNEGLINSSFGGEAELEKRYGFTLIGGESKNPKEVYNRMKAKINQAQSEGIPQDEIDRAKKVAKASAVKLFNSIEGMGNSFIRLLMKGINPLNYAQAVDSITKSDIDERLKSHFDTSNCVLSTVLPIDDKNNETAGEE